MSLVVEHFRHCPRCGEPASPHRPAGPFQCGACDFVFFFNPAVAAGVFLRDPAGRLLFLRRAKDPAKGKLALPGGFIDLDETAEEGLRREVREEVGLELGAMEFLMTAVNRYPYREVTYPVVDLFFTASMPEGGTPQALDGVAGFCWLGLAEVRLAEVAFGSIRAALERLRESV